MKKRAMTLFLALVMCLTLIPVLAPSAQAYTTGDTYPQRYKDKANKSVVDDWNFYNRQCTSFVAWCLNDRNGIHFTNQYGGVRAWGNAKNWGTVAKSLGITVDMNPAVGAVAWWKNLTSAGHVAWVSAVNGDKVQIEEYRGGEGVFRTREIKVSDVSGYIHIKDICLPSSGDFVIENGTYTLTPACAPNAQLDVAGGSQSSGQNIQIYTANGTDAQKWDISSLGNGYYKLTAKCSGQVLDAYYNNISSGQNVIQYPWDGGNYQQWKLQDAGDGYFYIIPRCNESLCLDVDSAYSSDGTNVQVYTANQSSAQKWKLTPADQADNAQAQHTHQGPFMFYETAHPHYNYYKCSTCGELFTDNTTNYLASCSTCNPGSSSWSDWSTTPVTATSTRQVETRQVEIAPARTEYRYGRYVFFDYRRHECWCQTYMTKLFGSATLEYSDWSATRYSPVGKAWTCGSCRGDHIGVDHYSNGKPWWNQYVLPDGDYFWEESRTVEATTQTQYRYRDVNNG